MKKITLIIIVLTVLLNINTYAQNNAKITIHLSGKNPVTYNLLDIDSITFIPCKIDTNDKIPPVITLTGSGIVSINLGESFSNLIGATANDDKDGNITDKIVTSGVPANSDQAGEYIITYNVSDAAGNAATEVTQTLHIGTAPLAGTYINISDLAEGDVTPVNYDVTVTQSTTTFNKILLNNFGGYGTNYNFVATASGPTITLVSQNVTIGGETATITGTGTYTKNGNGTFSIAVFHYTEAIIGGNTTNFTATYPIQSK